VASLKQPAMFALRKVGQAERPPIEALMLAHRLPTPEQEYQFAKATIGRLWAFDYAWPDVKVALEVEGGGFGRYIVVERGHERRRGKSIPLKPNTAIRVGGRHNTGEGMQEDARKYNRAAILGWLVVRVTTTMIRDGEAMEFLLAAMQSRGWRANDDGTPMPAV
jgi:hypothetical protein